MNASTNPSIDGLLERREIINRIVYVPGVTEQNEAEILKRLRDDPTLTLPMGGVDPSTLHDRLRDITPPIDEEEDLEECRALERDARVELEREGCPPCYPSYLDIPLQNVPPEYEAITSYWRAIAVPSDVVLCAQRSDWKRFRANQTRWRQSSGFAGFMDRIRKRDVDVDWTHIDPALKTQLENWEEFEYYHNQRHKRFEKERDGWEKERDAAEKNPRYNASMRLTDAEVCEKRRQLSLEDIEAHEVLLRWIKDKKSEMMARITNAERSRHIEEGRVTKPNQRRSHRRIAMMERQALSKKTIGRAEQLRAKTARQGRARPQASPAKRRSYDTDPQRRRTLCGTETTTRSGRISKPPVRWVPG